MLRMKLRNEPKQPQTSPTRKALAVVPEKDGLSPAVDVKYLKPSENCAELYVAFLAERWTTTVILLVIVSSFALSVCSEAIQWSVDI